MYRKLKILISVLAITVVGVIVLKTCVRGQMEESIHQKRFDQVKQLGE